MSEKHFVAFKATDEQLRRLTGLAALLGVSRSEVLRQLVTTARIEETTVQMPVGTVAANAGDAVGSEAQRVAVAA